MLSSLRRINSFFFSKLSRESIMKSDYNELVGMIVKQYGHKQDKSSNSICLQEIQHRFNVISKGDWVLDIGAGPNFYWTDMAMDMAEHQNNSHRVISNDIVDFSKVRANHSYIKGNFMEQQVRTNIALGLNSRKFNTILIDVSPEFTGDLQRDGYQISQVICEAMYFSSFFLEKGGNVVCKVLNCESTKILDESGKILFHENYNFKPAIVRQKSPVSFLVMKGFAMNYNFQAMNEFLSRYRGSAKNKTDVVREYQNKYNWDPVQLIRNKAKNDILMFKMQGKSQRDIENMFSQDPFVNVTQILKQVRMMEKYKQEDNQTQLEKTIYKFTDGKLFADSNEVPTSREEWINFLQKVEAKMKSNKSSKKDSGKAKTNLQPLKDNQIYMKDNMSTQQEEVPALYIEADLQGDYEQAYEKQYIQQQMNKIKQAYPEKAQSINNWIKKHGQDKPVDLKNIFQFNKDQDQKEVHDLAEAIRVITDQQYKAIVDKERYHEQRELQIGKLQTQNRTKFKNR